MAITSTLGSILREHMKKQNLQTAAGSFSITHINGKQWDDLVEEFSTLHIDGAGISSWQTPEWLVNWGLRLKLIKEIH